ncbi:hypothetical protein MCI89_04920 [Muricomes sp. OA1]|uniref:Uncharacterized protein n=1 Tax=Hungatella hathewayi TaxID=154046 RepID=A0A3E2X204_9FIRM|nr:MULTISPECIES: hypothetical protein [Clostridia]MCH1971691.1 hypothetical protein [Muricomes sp. OA1]RGC35525.1 hypothetical protein DWX41_00595 [Hungatella hathewayi]GKH34960.1 hypothetical protein CE91St64_43670 [Faecalicatena contorta]
MRKRIFATLSTLLLALSICVISVTDVRASEDKVIKVDGSYLTTLDTSTGNTDGSIVTRGEHLMDGECSITKSGVGRIYVYAATTADHVVDYISTVIYVDQYNQETGKWDQIDCWQVEDRNTYYVSTNKMMMVDRGYYYRVHADHVAGMTAEKPYDEATSLTDGIYVN